MKTIKNILGILLALAVMTTFYSCGEDEPEYTPAEKPNTPEVFFPASNSTTIELSSLSNSFQVAIDRIKTDEAITVPLTVSDPSGLFDVPTSVSFAQGVANASISITYDHEDFEYDKYTELKLTVGDSHSTPYGISEYVMSVGVPAPWKSLGKAKFSDTWVFENTFEVEVQQHALEPSRYRIIEPYKKGENVEFQILSEGSEYRGVTVTMSGLVGYNDFYCYHHTGYVEDVYALHPSRFSRPESAWIYNKVKQFSTTGEPEVIQLAPLYYLFAQEGGWDKTTEDGVITIIFPGVVLSDYSVSIAYAGKYMSADDEVVGVLAEIAEVGEDVEYIRLAVVEGTDVDLAVEEIRSGNINSIEVTAQPGTIMVPFETEPLEGRYTIVAVTYGDGKWQDVASSTFKYTPPTAGETWKSLGMTSYTDDILAQAFSEESGVTVTYEVEVQESEQNPGKFRLVNPYAEHPWNDEGEADKSKNYYMVINAMDPAGVYIEHQNMGVNWFSEGNLYVYSFAAYYMDNGKTLEQVKADGVCGTYADGIITFPTKQLLCTFEGDSGLYYANTNGGFKVVIPGEAKAQAAPYNFMSSNRKSTEMKGIQVVKKKDVLIKENFQPLRN